MPSPTPASQVDLQAAWQGPAGVTAIWASLLCLCPLLQRWLLLSAGSSFLLLCAVDPAAPPPHLVTNKLPDMGPCPAPAASSQDYVWALLSKAVGESWPDAPCLARAGAATYPGRCLVMLQLLPGLCPSWAPGRHLFRVGVSCLWHVFLLPPCSLPSPGLPPQFVVLHVSSGGCWLTAAGVLSKLLCWAPASRPGLTQQGKMGVLRPQGCSPRGLHLQLSPHYPGHVP